MLSHAVPVNQILRIFAKARDGEQPLQEWRRDCDTATEQLLNSTGTGRNAVHHLWLTFYHLKLAFLYLQKDLSTMPVCIKSSIHVLSLGLHRYAIGVAL